MALAFWEESLPAIAPKLPAEHFGLDVRFVEFAPPAGQDDFLRYLRGLPPDVHVGDGAQLRTYHEWDYHPEHGPDGPFSAAQTVAELARHRLPDLADTPGATPVWPTRWRSGTRRAGRGGRRHLGGELFESGYRLRGFATFMADLVQRSRWRTTFSTN